MKSKRVLDLTPYYASWGVDVADFNPGGIARTTVEGDVADGVYGVGDFLGGNIFVYNKALFDAAGIPYPAADKSLTIQEYADICRKLAKPDPDPAKAVYGCSMPEWAPGIQNKDVFGADGRTAEGNLNSPEMVEAFNIAGQLVREKAAPGGTALTAIGESDLFAEGRLGITWTDFTETPKYDAAGLQYGLAPFLVIKQGESFVDTWTAPWGTFTESPNQAAALEFLRWLATDGQVVRMETSADPSLSMSAAEANNYGEGDADQGGLPAGPLGGRPAAGLRAPGRRGLGQRRGPAPADHRWQDRREAHPGRDGRRDPDGAGSRVDRVGEDRPVTA